MTRPSVTVFESADVRCWHQQDDALLLTITAGPRPSITPAVLAGFERALAVAEADFAMLVIGADQQDFAYGADLGDTMRAAAAGRPEALDGALDHYAAASRGRWRSNASSPFWQRRASHTRRTPRHWIC